MKFNVVSSGSKGNCTLVYSKGSVIQLDFGISKKKVVEGLSGFDVEFSSIKAFLITHDHSDHCSNVFNVDKEKLYASNPILPKAKGMILKEHILVPFTTIDIDPFKVTVLPLSHDAKNTVGFVIDDGEEKLAYITDTGFVPEKDFVYLQNLDYYIFESNHDPKMLYESKRPDYLIRRIISDTGHLSNVDSAYYLSTFIGDKTKEVILAHLSDECNTPEKALSAFNEVMISQLGYVPNVIVKAASDKKETRGGK